MSPLPRLVVSLLRARLTAERLEFVLGDLEEGMRSRGAGSSDALRWVWKETSRILLAPPRLARSPLPKERVTDVRAIVWRNARECRYATRSLWRSPWYSLTAIGVISVTIALATTIFSVVDGILFRPLPYARGHELYAVSGGFERLPEMMMMSASLPDVRHWTAAVPEVHFTAMHFGSLIRISDNESLRIAEVDHQFFDVLGVRPILGGFEPGDFAVRSPVRPGLITYSVWQGRFLAAPSVIGRMMVDSAGRGLRVAGVLPREFVFPHPAGSIAPEALTPLPRQLSASSIDPQYRWLQVLVRVPSAIAPGAVEDRLRFAAVEVARQFPPLEPKEGVSATRRITRGPFDIVRLRSLRHVLTENTKGVSSAVFATASVLVLLACLNLAGLCAGARSTGGASCRSAAPSARAAAGWFKCWPSSTRSW